MPTLLNQALDWAQRWRDRGPAAQRMYPGLPSGGTTNANASGSGSGGTTNTARPPSLAAAIYPGLPNAGPAAPPTQREPKP
jgi:hypothetical protein